MSDRNPINLQQELNLEKRNDPLVIPTPNVAQECTDVVDVTDINLVIAADGTHTISDFINGKPGQVVKVYIRTGSTVTISGSRIVRQTANPCTADRIYTFTYIDYANGTLVDKWIENI